ncbi:BP74-related protein [Fodinibius sediminis]|nr:hypothetical protein [Fodinibius sediminis]
MSLLILFFAACDTNSGNGEIEPHYFEFAHEDGKTSYRFVAKTSDPGVIDKVEKQLQLPFEQRNLHINGDIERGNGGYNEGWSWKFTPGHWDMVEMSVEVCDGRPQMVEDDLDYWVDQVGYFCPWSARVLREVNR